MPGVTQHAGLTAFIGATGAVGITPSPGVEGGEGSGLIWEFDAASLSLAPTVGGGTPTITRAGNTATRVNASGLVEVVNADIARFDYDPVTLALKGLLVEEARTNLLLRSAEFDNAAWTNTGTPVVTANVAVAPDGTTSADSIEDNEALFPSGRYQDIAVANDSVTRALSIFVKKTTGNAHWAAITLTYLGGTSVSTSVPINTNTGALGSTTGTTATNVVDFGAYWRVSLTATNNSLGNTTLRATLHPAWNSSGGSNNDALAVGANTFWGAQLEAGSFPTSHIPTTSAAVARNADDCSVLLSAISGYNFAAVTLSAELYAGPSGGSSNDSFAAISDASGNNSIFYGRNATNGSFRINNRSGGVIDADMETNVGSWSANALARVAYAQTVNDGALTINAAAPITDTSLTMPVSPTTFYIGNRRNAAHINGHIRKLRLFNKRVSNAELQAMTA